MVWSTTCDSSLRPKKYSIAAETDFGLISERGTHVLLLADGHALLHGAAELEEALAQFVGRQFVDGAQTAIAEVVDVVHLELGFFFLRLLRIAEFQQILDGVDEVDRPQRHLRFGDVLIELAIDAETADLAEAVAVGVGELLLEQFAGLFELRRVARPQPLVNLQQRRLVRLGAVLDDGGRGSADRAAAPAPSLP